MFLERRADLLLFGLVSGAEFLVRAKALAVIAGVSVAVAAPGCVVAFDAHAFLACEWSLGCI